MERLHTLSRAVSHAQSLPMARLGGTVSEVSATFFRVKGVSSAVTLGDILVVDHGEAPIFAEVVRIEEQEISAKPFQNDLPLKIGLPVWREGELVLRPHQSWKGRVLDGLARPLDGGPTPLLGDRIHSYDASPPLALQRQRVLKTFQTGVLAMDLFTPLCAGQRIGVFAGSGVGKSTLLSMLAKGEGCETVVVALVGERGREVREFLEDSLGEAREKAVCIVATGDESPMMRRLAPQAAMAVAEFFRDRGEHVLLIIDSVTRYAHACREIAFAAGEPPVARGYAPSVFSNLPRLLERAGPGPEGSGQITGIFSVLVDGDDHNDPVADSIRGTLDGHIVLDRTIAEQGRYPAIDLLASLSRLAPRAWTEEQRVLISRLRALMARFEETRDLRIMGGYQPGSDPELDTAVGIVPQIYDLLVQSPSDPLKHTDPFQEVANALKAKST